MENIWDIKYNTQIEVTTTESINSIGIAYQGYIILNNTKLLEGNVIIKQYNNVFLDMFLSVTTCVCFHNDNCAVFALTTIGKIQNIMLFLSYKADWRDLQRRKRYIVKLTFC